MAAPADVTVRWAVKEDCAEIVRLIKELAVFEKIEDQVKIGEKELAEDGFGAQPFYQCIVAQKADDTSLVGYCLFYYVYSTFQGRSAYLEDIYVTPDVRGRGVGSRMLSTLAQAVLNKGCVRLDFIVLNWNERSIRYYERLGGTDLTKQEKWHLFRIDQAHIRQMAAQDAQEHK